MSSMSAASGGMCQSLAALRIDSGAMDPATLAARQMPMFIAMDRPEHTGQRRTVAPAFTARSIVSSALST